jgi:hypothetical protein
MTQKEAKELTLELWGYLAEHPECISKSQTPKRIWHRVWHLNGKCPLCHVLHTDCTICPLGIEWGYCANEESAYRIWCNSRAEETGVRKKAALRIVEIVSKWEPEESGK